MAGSGRVEVVEGGGRLRLVIRTLPSALVDRVVGIWLALWLAFEVTLLGRLADGSAGFLAPFFAFFLVGWTAAGAGGVLLLAWNRHGRVEIEVDADEFSVRRAVGTLGRTWRCPARAVEAVRLRPVMVGAGPVEVASARWSALVFDHGRWTRSVGVNLGPEDGAAVLDVLRRHLRSAPSPSPRMC